MSSTPCNNFPSALFPSESSLTNKFITRSCPRQTVHFGLLLSESSGPSSPLLDWTLGDTISRTFLKISINPHKFSLRRRRRLHGQLPPRVTSGGSFFPSKFLLICLHSSLSEPRFVFYNRPLPFAPPQVFVIASCSTIKNLHNFNP